MNAETKTAVCRVLCFGYGHFDRYFVTSPTGKMITAIVDTRNPDHPVLRKLRAARHKPWKGFNTTLTYTEMAEYAAVAKTYPGVIKPALIFE